MKPLFRAMSSTLENFIPPKRGHGFEDVCLDIFRFVLEKRDIPLIGEALSVMDARGVSGDNQAGIDIFDPATLAVAQCKHLKELHPRHLAAEANKLLKYGERVSHYFFLISQEGVKRSLQDWVRSTNRSNGHANIGDDFYLRGRPDKAPKFHIVGWGELKGYLLESNFLMWKWGLAHPIVHQYPYLPSLDVKFLVESIENVRTMKLPVRRDSKDAVAGMLRSIDIDALSKMVSERKVHRAVFEGLGQFVTNWHHTWGVAKTYQDAVRDIDSRDPIIMEEGFALMNELARHLPRISVLKYLHDVRRAAEELLGMYRDEDSFDWEDTTIEVRGEVHEVEGNTILLFNFSKEDWTNPYWVDPNCVGGVIDKIVEGVKKSRVEAL